MGRRIQVAQVITRFDVGGAQETVLALAKGLDPAEFEVFIVTGPDPGSGGSLIGEARAAGIPVVVEPSLVWPIRPWSDAAAARRFERLSRRTQPDIVHTHSSKAGLVGRLAARRAQVPATAHTVHGWSFHRGQRPGVRLLFQRIEASAARWATVLVVVSQADQEHGLEAGIGRPDQYRLIRSGIDPSAFQPAPGMRLAVRAALGLDGTAPAVAWVGRLAPQKDPLAALRIAGQVQASDGPSTLVMVGDGPLAGDVDDAIAGSRIGVRRLGVRRDLGDILGAMDALLLTSRWEGLPRVVLEARAAGVPVVGYAVDGVPEAVTDGVNGRLVSPSDEAALAAALEEVLSGASPASNPAPGLPGEFTTAGMVERTAELYRSLAPRR